MATDYLWPNLESLPYFRGFLRAIEARLLQSVELPAPRLDVGCGDGHFGEIAFAQATTLGVDPALNSLREARRRPAYRWLAAAEGARLPLARASMASAVSNSVLEHIPDVQSVLQEIGRVLKPGGTLAFTVPNPGYLAHLALPAWFEKAGFRSFGERYRGWFRSVTRVEHLAWEDEWREWLERAGLELQGTLRYFPPAAMRVLEWGHYLGLPSLVARKLTGRWILAPAHWNLWLTARAVRPYYDSPAAGDGTFNLYLARRP
jgi:SAM-dependent methyltransferase